MFAVIENDVFDPAILSLEDNAFLIEHMGEPLEAATANGVPPNVTPASGLRALDELYRFGRRCEANGDPFVGFEALKDACKVFLREHAANRTNVKRGAPKFPSMYEWDTFGRPHLGGVGSDSERMRSYFDENGNRKQFAVKLLARADMQKPAWLIAKGAKTAADYRELVEDAKLGAIACPICKFTQNYEPGSRGKRAQALARMGKHLKGSKRESDLHRQLYTYVFGS